MNIQEEYQKKQPIIQQRLNQFKQIREKDYFYELCFCLLTPQSSAFKADACIQELKQKDFLNNSVNPAPILLKKTRFHNNKAGYLLEFKSRHLHVFSSLKKLNNPTEKRDFLVKAVTGLGLKESSHFLRNVGYENLAILDRHILKNLLKLGVIKELPKTLTRKTYLEIEEKFLQYSKEINIPLDHLDLLFWSMETGEVFK